MSKMERRLAERRAYKVQVQMERESQLQRYYSQNISRGGIFLVMEELVPIGDEVQLSFAVPGRKEPVKLSAKAVRHHVMTAMDEDMNPTQIKGVGFSFANLSAEDLRFIEQYIAGKGLAVQG